MTTLELPDLREWTPEKLERLSPEFRYELREGNLVIMAAVMRPWYARLADGPATYAETRVTTLTALESA